jgi:hypothetical protein
VSKVVVVLNILRTVQIQRLRVQRSELVTRQPLLHRRSSSLQRRQRGPLKSGLHVSQAVNMANAWLRTESFITRCAPERCMKQSERLPRAGVPARTGAVWSTSSLILALRPCLTSCPGVAQTDGVTAIVQRSRNKTCSLHRPQVEDRSASAKELGLRVSRRPRIHISCNTITLSTLCPARRPSRSTAPACQRAISVTIVSIIELIVLAHHDIDGCKRYV